MLTTVGSLGDLHPFLAIAVCLKARGYRAVVATHAEYREKIENAGLEFSPVRPSLDDVTRTLGLSRAELTQRAIENPFSIYRLLVFPYLHESHDDLARIVEDDDTLVTSSLAFAARFIAEKRSIPWLAIVLQPMLFLSACDPPIIDGGFGFGRVLRWLHPRVARIVIDIVSWTSRPLFRPIDRFRELLGLSRSLLNPAFQGQFGPAGAIGLYSEVLGKVQPDFPKPARIVGFTWFDSEDGKAPTMSGALHEFLSHAEAPIVMTLGSVVADTGDVLYAAAIQAAQRMRRRIVVLAGAAGAQRLAALASSNIYIGDYEPHSLLFARAVALIHHGGIGTLAQALRSGRPQLMVPVLADQTDNAQRAFRLGLARVIPPRRFRTGRIVDELTRLISDDRFTVAATATAARVSNDDGANKAADRIIELANRPRVIGTA